MIGFFSCLIHFLYHIYSIFIDGDVLKTNKNNFSGFV